MEDKSTYNLLGIFKLKCSANAPSICLQCESCKLIDRVNRTKSWFSSLGYKSKKLFLEELISSAPDLMNRLPSILYSLHGKDYQYAKSSLKPSNVSIDDFQNDTNHSLDIRKIEGSMAEYISWFKSSSEWTRSNYVLVLLQMCSTQLLDSVKDFVIKRKNVYNFPCDLSLSDDKYLDVDNDDNNNDYDVDYLDLMDRVIPKCKSAPLTRDKRDVKDKNSRNGIHSARERVLFDDKVKFIDIVPRPPPNIHRRNVLSATNTNTNSILPSSMSTYSRGSSRLYFCPHSSSSARCTPVIPSISLSGMDMLGDIEINSSTTTRSINISNVVTILNFDNTKDFIKCLPIHLAKKVFGYLDERSLEVASRVSNIWTELGKQVKEEVKYIQARKEDVMLMQSTGAKTPHSSYARTVPVFIPKLNSDGKIQVNTEAKHVDVEVLFDEFADINMESCYDGHNIETRTVPMEERNVYCSSYNVLMLESRPDTNRHIHYDGGDRVSFGSSDRKIHVINVNTGKRLKTIPGHSASIKCLRLDEKNDTVVSGSYDTTIRIWNVKNGRCKVIFLGHQGTIVSLAFSERFLISSAGDCNIKIWNLLTGKCISTLNHSSVVKTLKIQGNQIVAGSSNGEVICWDMATHNICKIFLGHEGSVNCLWCNRYFIFSGSSDGFVKLWNNMGNFDSKTCLKTFRHPGEVLCLEVSFCRLITGCFDGKIRIWNMLNGSCLRVIRGNSKNDAISYLFASADRLVVNTVSSILVYNFESVKWNYSAPREQGEVSNGISKVCTNEGRPHAYTRAQKLIYYGSPLHKIDSNPSSNENTVIDNSIPFRKNLKTKSLRKISEAKSVPMMYLPCNKAYSGVTISRINSAPNASKRLSSVDQHVSRIKSASLLEDRRATNGQTSEKYVTGVTAVFKQKSTRARPRTAKVYDLKGTCIKEMNSNDDYPSSSNMKPTVRTRCRSAPVQRVITLPPSERGASTSSFTLPINASKKMVLKVPNTKKMQRPVTATPHASPSLKDLRLRTFHSQLNFEEEVRKC